MRRTCVFFHAHPDDEALLTAGTMTRLAAEGHRVVLVVATSGERGLTADPPAEAPDGGSREGTGARAEQGVHDGTARMARLGEIRTAELHASARALGCERVVLLGYEDSGLDGSAPGGFARAPVPEAAAELAGVLRQEAADLLVVYDPAGGYGHPDHVQVHRVGREAATLAGTPVVLEATVDRDLLLRVLRPLAALRLLPRSLDVASFERAYASAAEITHRVRVRRFAAAKRTAMAAHASQATGGDSVRTLAALLRLPWPVFRRAFGTEWFVRRDLPPGTRLGHPLDAWPAPSARPVALSGSVPGPATEATPGSAATATPGPSAEAIPGSAAATPGPAAGSASGPVSGSASAADGSALTAEC
ncbi:PIG-L family deacetylase [Actinomadura logoneensis]|uniref:PIG-L family deacetylase n=1 Tax=Actinomadura logoneensis TaxID=2293572 RepID=A0A372JUZ9_9ACTN|nr:PIG-L family deacetylase [Actinomadura logoneensis]RFU43564.1 PIG-L family deacetylase [Actinomadura logoneensis]